MTVRTSEEAILVALAQTTNAPGTCQMNVHDWYDAPSVGDVDRDGDADAVDGWESEPKAYRHPGDRTPPDGVPLAFGGGSRGFGHRCMTLSEAKHLRSTDMNGNVYSPGVTGTVRGANASDAIAILERSMNVQYLGWSETISGQLIPNFKQKPGPPPAPQTRGPRIDLSLRKLRKAHADALINHKPIKVRATAAAIKSLLSIPTHDKKL